MDACSNGLKCKGNIVRIDNPSGLTISFSGGFEAIYTLRRTGLSDPQADDWQPHYKGVPVGRIYRGTFAGEVKYRWTIYINHDAHRAEGVQIMGIRTIAGRSGGSLQEKL